MHLKPAAWVIILLLSFNACTPLRLSASRPLVLAILPEQAGSDLFRAGMRAAAGEKGARVAFIKTTSPEVEARAIDKALKAKPSALVISPLANHTSLPVLQEISDAGVSILWLGTVAALEESTSAFLPGPNRDLGSLSAGAVQDWFALHSTLHRATLILPCSEEPACSQRLAGFREHLASSVQIVEASAGAGQAEVEDLLIANPQISVVWAAGKTETRSAVQAVQARNAADDIYLIGADLDNQAVDWMDSPGLLNSACVTLDYQAGYDALTAAVALARGETLPARQRINALLLSAANSERAQEYLSAPGKLFLPTLPALPEPGSGIKPGCGACFPTFQPTFTPQPSK